MSGTMLNMTSLEIPFKQSFVHATATRSCTETVLVKAELAHGVIGIGEGCPRKYVTGETVSSALKFFEVHQALWESWTGLREMQMWMIDKRPELDANPAAWCAVEIALLDLWARENGISIEAMLGRPELAGSFQYSAVLGTDNLATFQKQATQFSRLGFVDFKVKLSGELDEDCAKCQILLGLGVDSARVRVDANNLWNDSEEAIAYLQGLPFLPWAIEEPLGVGDYSGCHALHHTLGVKIILDESFLRADHFSKMREDKSPWVINLRISKMGGIQRSLAVGEQAKALGIPLIIGAQVGETSILTRAALTVANSYREILLAQEGGFGTYLLEHDITDTPLMFGSCGSLDSQSFSRQPGLGLFLEEST